MTETFTACEYSDDRKLGSLREALYEPSQEFYANHYKRNRRKRGRLPSNPNQLPYPVSVPPGTKVLLSSGWAARYDYKAGLFAEMRGDFDIARRQVPVAHASPLYGLIPLSSWTEDTRTHGSV
jgi:hypothetical protein